MQGIQSFSTLNHSAVIIPSLHPLHMKASATVKTKWADYVSREQSCVFVCSLIIEALPGLLLLHQHVWSPPRVLEVPLERIRQDLCHLCKLRLCG